MIPARSVGFRTDRAVSSRATSSNDLRRNRQGPARLTEITTPSPTETDKKLKKRGFTFVGTTICYALMQATGLVDDHIVGCFRHGEVGG